MKKAILLFFFLNSAYGATVKSCLNEYKKICNNEVSASCVEKNKEKFSSGCKELGKNIKKEALYMCTLDLFQVCKITNIPTDLKDKKFIESIGNCVLKDYDKFSNDCKSALEK